MQVKELIGTVVACGPGATLMEAAQEMIDRGVGALIVRDDGGMRGILSERDVLKAGGAGRDLTTERAGDWMTTEVGSVDESTDIDDAAAWLLGAGYRHLPVTAEAGEVVGVVSIKDILWAIRDAANATD